MNKKLKKGISLFLLLFTFLSLIPLNLNTDTAYASFEEGSRNNCYLSEDSEDKSGNTEGSGSGGDWTQEGTPAYEIAKNVWDFWKGKGYSGAAIAGVHGNIAHEGGFEIPDRAEGHFGGDSKTSGISAGNEPKVGSGYPVGKTGKPEGGGGHYQFTPYTKFADLSDEKWLDSKAQSEFVWESEAKSASWGKTYAQSSSVEEAVQNWFKWYERGAAFNSAKTESAKTSYKTFGGDSVSFDSSLFTGSQDKDEDGETGNAKGDSKDKDYGCYTGKSDNSPKDNIVEDALSLLGYFSYLQVHGVSHIGGDIKNPKKSGVTDCSGFVWLVLARTGYNVPDNMQWFTGSMAADAKGDKKWLEEIKPSEAKAGDIIIANLGSGVGNDGHTAILTEDYHGNETKIVEQGGAGNGSVSEGMIGTSFGYLLSGDVIYARALKGEK